MPNILVAYATTEGQTRKVARFVGDELARRQDDVRLVDLTDAPDDLKVEDFDAVILAASVHVARFQPAAMHFAKTHAGVLNVRPSAFLPVSLSAYAGEEEDEENAVEVVQRFVDDTGWTPRVIHHVAGALRFSKYDFFKKWVMKRIAAEHDVETSGRDDIEFTDWRDLEVFAKDFAREHIPGG